MRFAWDPRKAAANYAKHGVSFDDAITAFSDPLSRTIEDPDHSQRELRFLLIGTSAAGRLLVVSHVDLDYEIRVISARPASRRERFTYEET
ncbi:MAG: BrnT family toxin [Gammaproteobacteria bacterium]